MQDKGNERVTAKDSARNRVDLMGGEGLHQFQCCKKALQFAVFQTLFDKMVAAGVYWKNEPVE
jgi:hypothetical protein